jgi:biopolymer transport protein ExbD
VNIPDDTEAEDFVINLTPMIDVVFLLLIFFMVSTTFLDPEREIEVELPSAESAGDPEEAPNEIILNILENGQITYQGAPIQQDELVGILKRAAQHDPDTPVTIRGHKLARHENVVSVMDACGIAGLSNLAIGTSVQGKG